MQKSGTEKRTIGRHFARELTEQEVNLVSGGATVKDYKTGAAGIDTIGDNDPR